MLTINMLGKGAILYNNECISDKLSSKLVALICLLVLNKGRTMSKDKIIAYLWPDSDDEAAKSNLRFNLWNIKKCIPQSDTGEDFIISGKDSCRINEKYAYSCDKVQLDCVKASQIENIEELLALKDLFKGDFLEGLYLRNCNEFNEMILFERVVCQNKQVEILEKLIKRYEEQGRFEEELQILNEVAAIEPFNESFAFQAISIYGKLGNRTAAINYYKNFEIVLRRNLNTAPNSELKKLYKELTESSGGMKPEPKNKEFLRKKQISVKLYGLRDVEYYGAAELIDQIFASADRNHWIELYPPYLSDLSYIYNGFRNETGSSASDFPPPDRFVPPVRISFAFIKLMEQVLQYYDLQIEISDCDEIDQTSMNLIRRMENLKPNSVRVLLKKQS